MSFPLFWNRPVYAANALMSCVKDSSGACFSNDLIGKRQLARNPVAQLFKSVGKDFSDGWGFDWQRGHLALLHTTVRSTVGAITEFGAPTRLQRALEKDAQKRGLNVGVGVKAEDPLDLAGYRILAEVHFFQWCFITDGLSKSALAALGVEHRDMSLRQQQIKLGLSTANQLASRSGATSYVTSALASQVGIQMASQGVSLSTPGLQLLSANRAIKNMPKEMYNLAQSVMTDFVESTGKGLLGRPWLGTKEASRLGSPPDSWRVYSRASDLRVGLSRASVANPQTGFSEGGYQSVSVVTTPTGGNYRQHGWGNAAVVSLTPLLLEGWGSARGGKVHVADWSRIDAGEANLQREDLWTHRLTDAADRPSGVALPNPLSGYSVPAYPWDHAGNGSMVAPATCSPAKSDNWDKDITWSQWSSWSSL